MIKLWLMILSATVTYSMENGSPTRPKEFTYIVSVQRENFHACSGVVIHEAHVMTIAHIIDTVPAVELRVIGGMNPLIASRIFQHNVKGVYIHPGFGMRRLEGLGETYDNDIALLRLQGNMNCVPTFAPVSLEIAAYDWNNPSDCILISWEIPRGRESAKILTWEFIKIISKEVNLAWATFLGGHKKFFSDFFGTATIDNNDLGSPIVCGNFMKGLVVQAEQEVIGEKSSVLMSIAPYLGFIQEIVQDGLFYVEPVKYPYIASIWFGNIHVCGGFILDATHIATAGHCVSHKSALDYTVVVGYSQALPQWLSIAYITIHPHYKVESTHQPPAWYIDHDFAILTLAEVIVWNEGARPLTLPESGDFREDKICELLRWKSDRDVITGVDAMKLMSSRVLLMDECSQLLLDPSTQSQVPSFWGRSQYAMPIADSRDVGNPIICEGYPVGFLIQAVPIHGELSARAAKFLKIRPYMEFSLNMLN